MSWKIDKRWSDKFIPNIKPILGTHFIAEPPIEEDRDRNTDLIVLNMASIRFGCRIRRYSYYKYYGNEFTIRLARPSEQKTEFEKIIEGWGDYFFYGFSNKEETDLEDWFIGDLKIFRGCIHQLVKNGNNLRRINNIDNSSEFLPFKKNDFPEDFIFAEKPKQKEEPKLEQVPEVLQRQPWMDKF